MSRPALALLFLLSGAGALIVETTWLRWFRELLGGSAPAVSATLVAFFTGHGVGAAWALRMLRTSERPLRRYAVLEAAAAVACTAVPLLLWALQGGLDRGYEWLLERGPALAAARYACALVATLPAGVCFGATLPVLVAAAGMAPRPAAPALYATNTAGAAVGTALATFWLPDLLGVRGGYGIGVGLLLAAAAGAFSLARNEAPVAREVSHEAPPGDAPLRGLPALAALSGFGALATQVLLNQAFARVLNQSAFAFGAVAVVILVAMAVAAAIVDRAGPRVAAKTWVAAGFSLAGLGWVVFPALFVDATDGLTYLGSDTPWPGYLWRAFGLAAACAGPIVLAQALIFPALLAAAHRVDDPRETGSRVAGLVAWNTVGGIAGALVAPYLLLPGVGLWLAFAAVAVLFAGSGLWIPLPSARARLWRDAGVAIAWIVVISRASPVGLPPLALPSADQLLFAEQTPAGLVAVVARDGGRILQVDNHYALGGTADAVHQERQGHLPLLLHPVPRRVAFLGSATGSSAAAALAHPVEALTLVELIPAAADAARVSFRDANRGVYDDPRTRVALDDARNFLRATSERYDVLVADLFVPWRAGTGSLYTREHFEAARAHLASGGVFCQWLPLYQLSEPEWDSIHAAFVAVFPDALVFRGDFYGDHPIVALVGGVTQAGLDRLDARVAALSAAGVRDRWVTHPRGPHSLYVAPLGPAPVGARINTDDRPVVEFVAARSHAGGARGKLDPLTGLRWVARAKALREAADARGDDPLAASRLARAALEGGHALQAASALYVAGRSEASGQALAAAASALPPELLADAAADPTAADVWHAGPSGAIPAP